MHNLKIYLLKDISPEIKAVTFAKCSRCPDSFDSIAKELTADKSKEFHEKWVVGYGHSSVAEHAILSIALENVSILATKAIEDNRLASYTEKSTRYQIFNKDTYHIPKIFSNDPEILEIYTSTSDFIFNQYEIFTAKISEFFKTVLPKEQGISDAQYNSIIKSNTCDVSRYLLTTATQTNLGMTINARALEHAITKLLSHPIEEMREIGELIKTAAKEEVPTLIKYADKNNYIIQTENLMQQSIAKLLQNQKTTDQTYVSLVEYNHQAEEKLISALLYKHSTLSYLEIKEKIKTLSAFEKEEIILNSTKHLSTYDQPLRELEHIYYTFDILVDYGAFRDIQRHRMCTQTNQLLTTSHGFETPELIKKIGLEKDYILCMGKAKDAYDKISQKYPFEAQYILPMAFKKRVLMTMNLRELHHFIPLRSNKKGHWFYRMIAQECFKEIEKVHPFLAKYIKVNWD